MAILINFLFRGIIYLNVHEKVFHDIDVYSYSAHVLFSRIVLLELHAPQYSESLFLLSTLCRDTISQLEYTTCVVTLFVNIVQYRNFLYHIDFYSSYNWNITIVDLVDRRKFAFVSGAVYKKRKFIHARDVAHVFLLSA